MKRSITIILIILVFYSCAVRKVPGGGPIDTVPPKISGTDPGDSSLNFSANKIIFYFDEYVTLKGLENNITVNPSLKYPLSFKNYGKKIVMTIKDTLLPNTTYTLLLSKGITDVNVGNEIENIKYVLSTGNTIDNGRIEGKVEQANGQQIISNILIGLYNSNTLDTNIMYQKPIYTTYTEKSGKFNLEHIKNNTYKIVAFQDFNNNKILDRYFEPLSNPKNTIVSDSSEFNTLLLFKEEFPCQKIVSHSLSGDKAIFKFTQPIKMLIAKEISDTSKLLIQNIEKDSIEIWMPHSKNKIRELIIQTESTSDTIKLFSKEKSRVKDSLLKITTLPALENNQNSLNIKLSEPIFSYDSNLILLKKESKITPVKLTTHLSNILLQKTTVKENGTLIILPKAITGYYGTTNKDTLIFPVNNFNPIQNGSIKLKILLDSNSSHSHIVQITNMEKIIIYESNFLDSLTISKEVIPGTYNIFMFEDKNNNNKFDNGTFYPSVNPEKGYIYPQVIVKPKWKNEQLWDIRTVKTRVSKK